jgi:hypothetical protein
MESIMRTTVAGQQLRAAVATFMAALAVPDTTPSGTAPVARDDGVLEFYKHWLVRGEGSGNGLYATYSDNDDVIEFGLSERDGEIVRNVLQATLVLDGDGGELNVMSEARDTLNVDAIVTPEDSKQLDAALAFFREIIQGA